MHGHPTYHTNVIFNTLKAGYPTYLGFPLSCKQALKRIRPCYLRKFVPSPSFSCKTPSPPLPSMKIFCPPCGIHKECSFWLGLFQTLKSVEGGWHLRQAFLSKLLSNAWFCSFHLWPVLPNHSYLAKVGEIFPSCTRWSSKFVKV